jgi:hypothetical protein
MAAARLRVLLCASLGVLCASLLGCQRKAPGPEECARFAQAVVTLAAGNPWLTPQMQSAIDDETRQCLTRPYDRELLNCVLITNRARPCLQSFRSRTRSSE